MSAGMAMALGIVGGLDNWCCSADASSVLFLIWAVFPTRLKQFTCRVRFQIHFNCVIFLITFVGSVTPGHGLQHTVQFMGEEDIRKG